MIGGRSALLSAAGGGNPYGNWTENYSDVSLLLRGYRTLSLPKYGNSCLLAGTSPNYTWGANRIQVPAGPAFAYGTGDFTVEAWVYPTAFNNGIFWCQTVSGTNYFLCTIAADGRPTFTGTLSGGGSGIFGPVIPLNAWSHVAIVRNSGIVTVYSNGIGGTPVSNTTNFSNTTYVPTIGSYTHNTSQGVFNGLIDDLRITKGVARYVSNFTPPTAELPASTTDDPSYNSVSLLLRGNLTPELALADESSTPKVVTVFGSATSGSPVGLFSFNDDSPRQKTLNLFGAIDISTATWKYSGSSLSFGGGHIRMNGEADFAFGTGDYTVEFWIYFLTIRTADYGSFIIDQRGTISGQFMITANPVSGFGYGRDPLIRSNTPISLNTWYHFALTRQSGNLRLFVDGEQRASMTDTLNVGNVSGQPVIGGDIDGPGSRGFTGFIDDLRITKGFARYTKNFLPPPAELPAI